MASRATSPDHSDDDSDSSSIPTNAGNSFTKPETSHALDLLLGDPAAYISGNGFKSKAFTDISTSLKKKFPDHPVRSKDAIGNRLRYVIIREGYIEDYEFVRRKSGVGWDDDVKMATAEADFIATFTKAYSSKYGKCFKKPCPFYDHAKLFGRNKATSTHVLHLIKTKKTKSSSTSAPTPTSDSTSALKRKARQPLENLDNETINIHSDSDDTELKPPPSPKPYDDELVLPNPKRSHTSDTTIDLANDSDNENEDANTKPKKKLTMHNHNRSASAGSSSGGRRVSRNAEMGNEIACGLRKIGEGMSAPIIIKSNMSHIDAIIDAFVADPTLLPANPVGNFYKYLLDALGANEMCAHSFIKTQNCIQRIALLKRLSVEKEMDVPVGWV
ncbi:hypothetical protein K438DRAFT_1960633 [Mycena galopus ATCC 62051]|nr:hypothetical protein K438DRAFT_1960633 [Mycena galopus ATCC 62051]